jgi:hypothetical protein
VHAAAGVPATAPAAPRPLPAAAGLGAAPALGIPVPPQQQQFATQFAAGLPLQQLPPSAAEEWDRAAVLMSVWLGCASATLLLSLLTANTFAIAGAACAVVGACTHRFPSCRPGGPGNLAASVNRIHTLSIVAASLCGVVAALATLIAFGLSATCRGTEDREACAELTEATFWFALWYTSFCILSTAVSRRTRRMRLLLNPVSSGVVQL